MSALHAKVISVDRSETLITSANLSYHGQEGNVELGTHVISKDIAMQVERVLLNWFFRRHLRKSNASTIIRNRAEKLEIC